MTDCASYGTHQSLPATVDNGEGYVLKFETVAALIILSTLQQRR